MSLMPNTTNKRGTLLIEGTLAKRKSLIGARRKIGSQILTFDRRISFEIYWAALEMRHGF